MANSFDTAVVGLGLARCCGTSAPFGDRPALRRGRADEPLDWSTHGGVFASHYDSGRITRRLDKKREPVASAARAIDAYRRDRSEIRDSLPSSLWAWLWRMLTPDRLSAVVAVGRRLSASSSTRSEPGEPLADDRISVPTARRCCADPSPAGRVYRPAADARRAAGDLRQQAPQSSAEQVLGDRAIGRRVVGARRRRIVDRSRPGGDCRRSHADEFAGLPRTR